MIRHRSTLLLAACVTCVGWTVATSHNSRLEAAVTHSLVDSSLTKSLDFPAKSISGEIPRDTVELAQANPTAPAEEKDSNQESKAPIWQPYLLPLVVILIGWIFFDKVLYKWFKSPKVGAETQSESTGQEINPSKATINISAVTTDNAEPKHQRVESESVLPGEQQTPANSTTNETASAPPPRNSPPPREPDNIADSNFRANEAARASQRREHQDRNQNKFTTNGVKPQTGKRENDSALTVPRSKTSQTDSKGNTEDDDIPISETSRLGKAKKSNVEKLMRDLDSADPRKRRKAIWELAQRGDSRAVQPLVNLMVDSDSKQRTLILEALSQIGTKTLKPMQVALALSMQDNNPEVRKNAIRDLTRVYELIGQINQMLSYATNDPDAEVRDTAQWAINQLNTVRPSLSIEELLSTEGISSKLPDNQSNE